ncbi:transcriptional regulator with XRE-family HTH domain [Bacillus mesophilus]|uniref:Helix-turn-helix transcriptional regulator n=1 Tax=Bacillus mesophilus TaxID=1808955 RepID=A0A6M0Q4B7_9BACI|nr:helix-turn-helix transcriptional regulator [Bacillus mesophilus]MBM7660373.1 transcriptional regulator with XRE-family HTH domain [Bacillus mesophilus]NEY71082.1 helix-turn-helix transcriptional regulator [Bacillus mesophilus]
MSKRNQLFTKLLGQKLREQRQEMAETQDDFAEKLGIHVNNYGNIERGENLPGGQTMVRLILDCGIDLTELVREAEAEAKRVFPDEE